MNSPSLLSRLIRDEKAAQAEIIHAYQSRLAFYFSMRIKGDAPVEDLVQDVLASFFDSVRREKLQDDAAMAPYLFGIAKRVLYNFYYQSSKCNNLRQRIRQVQDGFENFSEARRLETDNLMEGIKLILNRMAPVDQQILKRFYLNQESIGEIAAALKLQRHYISVRKERALKRIRTEMKKQRLL